MRTIAGETSREQHLAPLARRATRRLRPCRRRSRAASRPAGKRRDQRARERATLRRDAQPRAEAVRRTAPATASNALAAGGEQTCDRRSAIEIAARDELRSPRRAVERRLVARERGPPRVVGASRCAPRRAARRAAGDRTPWCTCPGTASRGRRCPASSCARRAAPAPWRGTWSPAADTRPTRRCRRDVPRARDRASARCRPTVSEG